jgi:hypothetical protein
MASRHRTIIDLANFADKNHLGFVEQVSAPVGAGERRVRTRQLRVFRKARLPTYLSRRLVDCLSKINYQCSMIVLYFGAKVAPAVMK